ncbi:nickel-dependent hydrogenase large subunit [uncultured Clostridium sp.]|uniref:nickel-dependent hydrogenase large subunit n=1 Tax=uncultured Clostridium sp. TaxID=59620 RepID=UPI0034404BA6
MKNGVVDRYSVISPSNWNLSPTDDNGVKGPVEYALIGTEIKDIESPIEIASLYYSYNISEELNNNFKTICDNVLEKLIYIINK